MSAKLKDMSATQTSEIEEQLAILREDIRGLAAAVGDAAKSKQTDVTQVAKEKMADASEAVNETVETAKLRAMMVSDEANDFIRARPATALGIAAGLGFLVGMLGSRK